MKSARFLDGQREALTVMEHERAQLERDIEAARRKAHGLRISLAHAPESGYRAWLAADRCRQPLPPRRRGGSRGRRAAARDAPAGDPDPRGGGRAGLANPVLRADGGGADHRRCQHGWQRRGTSIASTRPTRRCPPRPSGRRRHALGVGDAVELARELDRLPPRLAVYGIEGESFEAGEGLSPAVEATVSALVAELHKELGGEDAAGG